MFMWNVFLVLKRRHFKVSMVYRNIPCQHCFLASGCAVPWVCCWVPLQEMTGLVSGERCVGAEQCLVSRAPTDNSTTLMQQTAGQESATSSSTAVLGVIVLASSHSGQRSRTHPNTNILLLPSKLTLGSLCFQSHFRSIYNFLLGETIKESVVILTIWSVIFCPLLSTLDCSILNWGVKLLFTFISQMIIRKDLLSSKEFQWPEIRATNQLYHFLICLIVTRYHV